MWSVFRTSGLRTESEPAILDWAARDSRVLVLQDIRTMPGFAYERVDAGEVMPGVFVLPPKMPLGVAIDELATIVAVSEAGEWVDRVVYLPLS